MLELRKYQLDLIEQARGLMKKGCKSIAIVSPCGSGKTALVAHMLKTASARGFRSIFVCHRRELIFQTIKAFDEEGIRYGVISAGFESQPAMPVQIASVQTLARRLNQYSEPRLIAFDECHHIAAASWSAISRRFPHTYRLGLTASPIRLDGKGLGDHFQALIEGPTVQQLISGGYLSPYKLYAPMRVSVEGVHTKMGDYARGELSGVMDKPSITGDAVQHYKKFCNGKRAIVFAVSIQHSKHIVEKFRAEGIHAEHVDGETEPDVRDRAIEAFKAGSIQVLSNVELFGEGFDVPAMEVAILLRPTQSTSLYLQQIGRALRPFEGKTTAIILDHVGNYERHGLPDEVRIWTLDGTRANGRNRGAATAVKVCPGCFAAQQAGRSDCKFCGYQFEVTPREVEQKDGELAEVDLREARTARRVQQGHTESLEGLTRLGIQRGYRYPRRWAYYVFKSRQARRLGKVA